MNTKYADRITPTLKKELWKRHFNDKNDGECKICNMVINKTIFTWKYIFPKARGGRNNILNLLPVCSVCDKQYSTLDNEINLITFLKNKNNISVELDDEYYQYQHNVMYFYSKAFNTGTFLNYIKPDKCHIIIPIIKYLISNNLYNPKWTLQEFKDFISIDPEYKEHPETDRRLQLQDITINDIEYSEINIHYSVYGHDLGYREISYNIKRKSTEYLGGFCSNGWLYFTKNSARAKYYKEVETYIQPYQLFIFY